MSLIDSVQHALDAQGMKLERFREIVTRLLAWGVVVRDEDGVEQRLYDDARRIEPLLVDYFHLAGFRLMHYPQDEYFRLYAPGAVVPGKGDDGDEPVLALRARHSSDFVAAALALRFLYQQGLADGAGRLSDRGEVLIRFDELAATLSSQLKRPIDAIGVTERGKLLNELRRHRILSFSGTFRMEDEDALMAIRPTILGIISEDTLAAALEDNAALDPDAEDEDAQGTPDKEAA
jgi:hypothetical protein